MLLFINKVGLPNYFVCVDVDCFAFFSLLLFYYLGKSGLAKLWTLLGLILIPTWRTGIQSE